MKKQNGITVVSPMYGERSKTDRMVFSVISQFISKDNPFTIHFVMVDDYIEGRGENNESIYDYYLSDDFKQFYDTKHIKMTLIKNEEHKYQGESREIGFRAGKYPFFLLLDCDDMLAPNACDRYLHIINDVISQKQNLACVYGYLYGFDTNGYEQKIVGESIWVQSRCFNRNFVDKHDIHFLTGLSSKQGEDYPFIRKFDYALAHDDKYIGAQLPYNNNEDCQCTAYWFPNSDSLSRTDPFYSQHLSGWTMKSSNSILDYFDNFNRLNNIDEKEDEYMKHEYLNMTIYAFYNLLDFVKTVSSSDYKPLEEDWYALRDSVKNLRSRLKEKYYDEIVYSDIEDNLYRVRHFSDCHFTECWFGTFYDYMETEHPLLRMSYDEMIAFCEPLEFDGAGHEIHSKQVIAWQKRHEK